MALKVNGITVPGLRVTAVKPTIFVMLIPQVEGITVTATRGDYTVAGVTDSTGTVTLDVPAFGVWKLSATGYSNSVSRVEQITEYRTTLIQAGADDPENCDWETVHYVSEMGFGPSLWSIGDTKSVTLSGTIGTLSVDNLTIDAFIIGFDHNQNLESPGEHRIHWQFGKIDGTMVGLVDSKYSSSDTSGTKYFNWNHWGGYNYGGWASSDIRYDVLGSTNLAPTNYGAAKTSRTTKADAKDAPGDTATNPVSNTWMSALPAEMRAVLKPVIKYTCNTGNKSNVESSVTGIKDFLPELSEFEVQGARTHANNFEKNYQWQYAYYASGNSKIAYKHNKTSSAGWWVLRSPYYVYATGFCTVREDGGASCNSALYAGALLPGFFT